MTERIAQGIVIELACLNFTVICLALVVMLAAEKIAQAIRGMR